MVKVSVVIPVYNNVSYIRECMESVINQTLQEIEIIIVDAGSTDGTGEILEEYAKVDARVRLFHSKKKSMGAQTNMGIAAATGEYIGFCESDDYLALTMYEKLYTIASANQLDFVKTDFDMFMDLDDRLFLNYHVLGTKMEQLYNRVVCPIDYPEIIIRDVNMWNGIYNREFLMNNFVRLNETQGAAFQDVGFILQTLALSKKVMWVHEEANRYRRDNSNSSVYNWKCLLFIVWEFVYAYRFIAMRKIQNQRFLALVLQKFLLPFCEYYGRLPENMDYSDEICQAAEQFKLVLKKYYHLLEYRELTFMSIDTALCLKLLLEDDELLDTYIRQLSDLKQKQLQDFYEHICQLQKTVIFGAGECGTACYVMLRKHDYNGVVCFCDNNEKLWNKEIMGLKVLSVNKVIDSFHGDISFIIANEKHWQDIYEQLLSLGVKEDSIFKSVTIATHAAFEVNLRENINKEPI